MFSPDWSNTRRSADIRVSSRERGRQTFRLSETPTPGKIRSHRRTASFLTPANVVLAQCMRDDESLSANAVAAQFGVSKSTLLRALRREELAMVAS